MPDADTLGTILGFLAWLALCVGLGYRKPCWQALCAILSHFRTALGSECQKGG